MYRLSCSFSVELLAHGISDAGVEGLFVNLPAASLI